MGAEGLVFRPLEAGLGEVEALEAVDPVHVLVKKPDDLLDDLGLAGRVLFVNVCRAQAQVRVRHPFLLEDLHGMTHEGRRYRT